MPPLWHGAKAPPRHGSRDPHSPPSQPSAHLEKEIDVELRDCCFIFFGTVACIGHASVVGRGFDMGAMGWGTCVNTICASLITASAPTKSPPLSLHPNLPFAGGGRSKQWDFMGGGAGASQLPRDDAKSGTLGMGAVAKQAITSASTHFPRWAPLPRLL